MGKIEEYFIFKNINAKHAANNICGFVKSLFLL